MYISPLLVVAITAKLFIFGVASALSDKPNDLPWVSSIGPTPHSSHVLSKKLVWSYKSPILPKRATDAGTGIQAHIQSPASGYSLPVPTPTTASPLSLLFTSVVDTLTEVKETNSPGHVISTSPPVPSASSNLTPASLSQTSASLSAVDTSSAPYINNPDVIASFPSPTASNAAPIISVLTADGRALTYSATFIPTAASVTEMQTATETDSSGVFGIIMFPDKGGRSWKFPCLTNCNRDFSTPSLGPPPGYGSMSGSGGGGGGGGGSDSGGGGADGNNPDKENTDKENETQSASQSGSTASETTSTSTSSSQCSTQTASSCSTVCPMSTSGVDSFSCSTVCSTRSGCSVTNTATIITISCSNTSPCLTACETTLGGSPVTCATHCTNCASIPSSPGMALAIRTITADSEATIWTVTVATDVFINPAYTFNSARAYEAMQSVHNLQKTLRPSGMTTRTTGSSSTIPSSQQSSILESSSISSGPEPIISSSELAPPSTNKQTSLISTPPVSPPSMSTMAPTVQTTSSSPPPHDTANSYIGCLVVGCVGIARDDAIKSIKSFCKKPTTINSATPSAVSSATFEGTKVLPTPGFGPFSELLVMAIELDSDPRCIAAEYKVNPPRAKKLDIVSGPDEKCVAMLESIIDRCNTDTVRSKLGGTLTVNCFAWSIFTGNAHGNC